MGGKFRDIFIIGSLIEIRGSEASHLNFLFFFHRQFSLFGSPSVHENAHYVPCPAYAAILYPRVTCSHDSFSFSHVSFLLFRMFYSTFFCIIFEEVPLTLMTGVYEIESLLIPSPFAFDFLPSDGLRRILKSMIFFPLKQTTV